MSHTTLDEQQIQILEDFGTYIESSGGARSLGKVLGYLLIIGEPRSLDDMVRDLSISKGTASLTVRQGAQLALFRKVGVAGSQRDYYELHPDAWTSTLKVSIGQGNFVRELIEKAKPFAANQLASDNIEETIAFFQFVVEETSLILERWEQKRKIRDRETESRN